MLQKKIPDLLVYSVSIAIGLFLLLSLFSILTTNGIRNFFSSDSLYLPSIYLDLFRDHHSLKGWHLSGAPNFFPDMMVYFFLMFLTNNFIVSSFIFSFVQYLTILFVIIIIYRVLAPDIPAILPSVAILLMTLFLLVPFYSKDFLFTFYLISNAYHTGAFLMGLVCMAITFSYLKRPRRSLPVFLFALSFVSVISDPLFIVLYFFPVCAIGILPLKHQKIRQVIKIFFVNLVALISGLIVFKILSNSHSVFIDSPDRMVDLSNVRSSFSLLFKQLSEYAIGMNSKSLIMFIYLLSFCGLNIIFFRDIRKKGEITLITVYSLFSIFYSVVVLFIPVLTGKYTGYDILRYNIYVFYLGIINTGILLNDLFIKNGKKTSFISFMTNCAMIFGLYILVTGLVFFSPGGLRDFFSYAPKIVQSLDEKLDTGKYKYGVANYWDAKLITLFSKKGIIIYSVHDDLMPWAHDGNENWYNSESKYFNFFVINHVADTTYYRKKTGTSGKFQQYGDAQVILLPDFRYEGGQVRMVKK